MPETLSTLLRKRGQIKARLTIFKEFVHNLQSLVTQVPDQAAQALSDSQVLQLESRIISFESTLNQYESLHGEILTIDRDENIETRYAEFCEFESAYFDVLTEAKLLAKSSTSDSRVGACASNDSKSNHSSISSNHSAISNHSVVNSNILVTQTVQGQANECTTSNSASNLQASPTTSHTSLVKLPVLQMKTYNGEPEGFLSFFESFKSLVHNNNQLDDISRFLYLKSVLGTEPSKVIESLDVISQNYQVALKLLERRYRNNKLLIHTHVKGLIELPKIPKESATALRQISDSFQAHLRALESLGEPIQSWSSIVSFLIADKLDYNSRRELETLVLKDDESPKISSPFDFLENRSKLLEKLDKSVPKISNQNQNKYKSSHSYVATSKGSKCIMCKLPHKLYYCKDFLALSVQQRTEVVNKHRLCQNCLQFGHATSNCKHTHCKKCSDFHSTLLHIEPKVTNTSDQTTKEPTQASSATFTSSNRFANNFFEILPTAIIIVYDNKGTPHKCTALLDSASMRSYMTTTLCSKLNLGTTNVNIPVTGINQTRAKITELTHCKIKSVHSDFHATLPFLLLQNITNRLPSSPFNRESLNIPDDLILANPDFHKETKIDILLGIDIFWRLLSVSQNFLDKYPYLINTHLGHVVSGKLSSVYSNDLSNSCNISILDISRQMSLFWEIEDINSPKQLSPEEQQCETHFIQTTKRDSSGRFIVSMPLSSSPQLLGASRQNALKHFISLEKRLQANHKFRDLYIDFMQEYEDLGHMRKVEETESLTPHEYFIPHHGVYKADSLTTKLRVVFNSSCPTSSGISLNDIQLNGPVIQDDLFSILIRFRRFKYTLTADCSKMYRSVFIDESQRCLQRIFWRSDPLLSPQVYELNTVTYGEKSSSFLAIRCLFQLADEHKDTHPKICKIIKKDMYCDDLLTSCKDEEEASYVCRTIFQVLQSDGFMLRKWNSNHPKILEPIQSQDISNNILQFGPTENSKTLGLTYNSYTDVFLYSIPGDNSNQVALTKRRVLSFISMIFDPLGLLAPCTIKAKIFMQQLWLTQTGWDESLSDDLQYEWNSYSKHLPCLNELRIHRQVIGNSPKILEIHAFSDSSQKAYGTCIYLRSIDNQNRLITRLLCSKTKVAPLKSVTIPKLELCAVLMMVKLTSRIKTILDMSITDTIYWTDSKIAISWVNTQPHLLETFVANRVSQIQSICPDINLYYVPTKENPADILTRGVTPNKLLSLEFWWNGPQFLSKSSFERPDFKIDLLNTTEIVNDSNGYISTIVAVQTFQGVFPFQKYSSLRQMQRIMAYCIRFIKNCRITPNERLICPLTSEELYKSLNCLAKLSQRESFPEDLKTISLGKSLSKHSRLFALTPFIDPLDGSLRACGRLINSQFGHDKKHPIIICAKHHFTKVLFREEHIRLFHAGPKHVLNTIRDRFWPIGGQNLSKQVFKSCVVCFKARPKNLQNLLGHLPLDRVKPQLPFSVVGTDYCGPFLIRDKKGRGSKTSKCYVCLFICFCTKAVHLELVTDLSTENFILCLRRFASRRGMPSKFYSDNGRTYCGAKSELQELGKFLTESKNDIERSCASENLNWIFLPPYSPNLGGIWEAGIKSCKFHLKRVMGNAALTYEQFYSILVQIEGVLNSRPLTSLSSQVDDYLPLTPSHFLIGKAITTVPDPSLQYIPERRLSLYQRLQQLVQNFWSRWTKEYISELQCRAKWKVRCQNAEVGSLVLLKDDKLPPAQWRLGRIIQIHRGSDKLVRVVTVSTSSGETKRAISKVCPLPLDSTIEDK